jgi:hypothetical protein
MYTVHITPGIPVGNGDIRIGTHGSTVPTGYQSIQKGSPLSITATPEAGYEVYAWQINGILCGHELTTYEIDSVAGDMTIGVLFKNTVYAEGTGTSLNPYEVYNVATLNAVNDELAANYIMINDIDLSGEEAYEDAVVGIEPSSPFLGVFDGNNKKISGLVINSHNNYLGLFGVISAADGLQGTIKNLTVEGVAIDSSASNIGGLCGLNQAGIIEKCRVLGAQISGDERVAGLCGYNNSTIRYSSAEGSIKGNFRIGLLTGNCYLGTVNDCYAIGTISSDGPVVSGGGISGDINSSTISNCYASCGFESEGEKIGGFCGWSQNSGYDDCVSNQDAYSISVGGSGGGEVGSVIASETSQMQSIEFWGVTDWDFVGEDINGSDDIWRMCEDGVEYPKLWWEFGGGDFVCGDGVDFFDFAVLADTWYLSAEQAGYNYKCDLSGDETIEFDDLAILANNWLEGI